MTLQLTSSDSLILQLSAAIATSQLDWMAYSADISTSTFGMSGLTPSNGQSNNTSEVTAVAAPLAGSVRQVRWFTVYNRDTVAATVIVSHANGATRRRLVRVTLQPDECLEWSPDTGWRTIDPYGIAKVGSVIVLPRPAIAPAMGFLAGNLTATKSITSGNSFAVYLGKADRALSSVSLRYRVTTAAATITWAEVAIAKGAPVLAGNPSLTRLGFTDVSGVVNSTGQKTTAVSLAGCQAGDDLWAIFGNQATTIFIVRAGLADDLQVGYQATAAVRPSTMGAGTAFTLEAAAIVAPWVAWVGT